MNVKSFFFCYDKDVAKYLKYEKGIDFITKALHCKTKSEFWMFFRNEDLQNALDELNKK